MPEEIPLQSGAFNSHQLFSILLGNNFLDFRMDYKTSTTQWSINITQSGTLIVAGAMLEPNCDIIRAWNLGDTIGQLICISENGNNPTLNNIGSVIRLLWYDVDE